MSMTMAVDWKVISVYFRGETWWAGKAQNGGPSRGRLAYRVMLIKTTGMMCQTDHIML